MVSESPLPALGTSMWHGVGLGWEAPAHFPGMAEGLVSLDNFSTSRQAMGGCSLEPRWEDDFPRLYLKG